MAPMCWGGGAGYKIMVPMCWGGGAVYGAHAYFEVEELAMVPMRMLR